MTSQADGVLIFVSNIGLATQTVSSLALPSTGTCANQCVTQADDTTFSDGGSHQTLLFADKATNIVYALTAPFGFNNAFAAYQDVNLERLHRRAGSDDGQFDAGRVGSRQSGRRGVH